MAKHAVPAPPRWLTALYLVAAGPLTLMMLALAVIGLSRGYLASGLLSLVLAVAVAGGVPSARQWRRRP
jgi:hypothetical protein